MYEYKIKEVVKVVDGDTVDLNIDLGFNLTKKERVRLAGIDAPEVAGHEHDPMAEWRINQSQPYGEEATEVLRDLVAEQDDLSLIIDPTQTTYGRYVGTLAGDEGSNINLELLRLGAVSALPWKSRVGDIIDRTVASDAETEAFNDELGMWRHTRYKAAKEMGDALGSRITHNTYTDLSKLAKNPDLAGFAEYLEMGPVQYRPLSSTERSAIRGVGSNLRRAGFSGSKRASWQKNYNPGGITFGRNPVSRVPPNYRLYTPSIPLTSRDDAYVNVEGLRHGGSAAAGRKQTDFGSGWKGYKNLIKMFNFTKTNDTYTSYIKTQSPVLDTSTHIKRGALKELSVKASAANRGISQSHIPAEKISQVKNTPGGNLSHSNLTLASKEHLRYSEPSRNRMSMQVPDFAEESSVSSKK